MGYRHYFFEVDKKDVDKVKDKTYEELMEIAREYDAEIEEEDGDQWFYFNDDKFDVKLARDFYLYRTITRSPRPHWKKVGITMRPSPLRSISSNRWRAYSTVTPTCMPPLLTSAFTMTTSPVPKR